MGLIDPSNIVLTQSAKQDADLRGKNPQSNEAIKKLSEEFESVFLEIVLESMRKSVQKSGFVDGGNGEEIFRSMLDSEYAKSLASQRTTGLAESIERHLLGLMSQEPKEATNKSKAGLKHYQKDL